MYNLKKSAIIYYMTADYDEHFLNINISCQSAALLQIFQIADYKDDPYESVSQSDVRRIIKWIKSMMFR